MYASRTVTCTRECSTNEGFTFYVSNILDVNSVRVRVTVLRAIKFVVFLPK